MTHLHRFGIQPKAEKSFDNTCETKKIRKWMESTSLLQILQSMDIYNFISRIVPPPEMLLIDVDTLYFVTNIIMSPKASRQRSQASLLANVKKESFYTIFLHTFYQINLIIAENQNGKDIIIANIIFLIQLVLNLLLGVLSNANAVSRFCGSLLWSKSY